MAFQTIKYEVQIQDTTIPDGCCGADGEYLCRTALKDQVADNFEQIWEEYSKDTVRRIL